MYTCNPMALRHTTPPTYSNGMWYPGSVESHYAPPLYGSSTNNSPDSVNTADTSPQRSSPGLATIRSNGPTLLPKIRCQDQTKEPTASTGPVSIGTNAHARAGSVGNRNTHQGVQMGVPTIHTAFNYGHQFQRRATASPEMRAVTGVVDSPMSACSLPATYPFHGMANTPMVNPALTEVAMPSVRPSPLSAEFISSLGHMDSASALSGSRRSSLAHVRSVSGTLPSPVDTHSRNTSTSTVIDENALIKHGYPRQYRGMPQYITATPSPVTTTPVSLTPTLPVQPLPALQTQQPTEQQEFNYLMPTDGNSLLSPQVTSPFEQAMIPHLPQPSGPTITLMNYLTGPGPTPNLIARSVTNAQAQRDFAWWDVRNLRSWTGFSMDTILTIPHFPDLLNIPLDQNALPNQGNSSVSHGTPENEYALRDLVFEQYGKRVNAALQISQGSRHMALRLMNSATNQHTPRPDFIATYANDGFVRTTARGELRGHVVGIVKSYDEWNTGMRSEDATRHVKYLRGLAQLHRIMREHSCRYGFIITEIELFCVRAGAEVAPPLYHANAYGSDEGARPIFGMVEVAQPIALSRPAFNAETGAPNMTVGLGLWFLCMLARDEPLPGQCSWKMDVGGPAALTRHNYRPRDSWMPKVGMHESRVAKRIRGWIYPEDAFSRKEAPNNRRGRK